MAQFNAGKTLKLICWGCDRKLIDDEAWMKGFLLHMADFIGMTKIHDPISMRLDCQSEPDKEGISVIMMIAESHIACHCWRDDSAARFIIDSCKDFDVGPVVDKITEIFKPSHVTAQILGDSK